MKVFVVDNYDSFTYNLVHILEDLGAELTVKRNDSFELNELNDFHRVVLSPGPGLPHEAGKMNEVIRTFYNQKNILGVCLGHQAIGEVFGAKLVNLETVYHGVTGLIDIHIQQPLFIDLPNQILAGRYHSWVLSDLPDSLEITATDGEGNIMGIKHKELDIFGLQFHPESILSPDGKQILSNWLKM